MKNMKFVFVAVMAASCIWLFVPNRSIAASGTASFEIPKRGAAPMIVVGAQATASEKFAAEELSTYLGKMTGKTFKIVDDTKVPKGKIIAVGKSRLTESVDVSKLGIEQYVMDVTPKKLAIIGGRQSMLLGRFARDRGTLYGVYDLLDELGVKWYRPEVWGEFVPKVGNITVPVGRRVSRQPDYIMRSTLGGGYTRFRESTPEMRSRMQLWSARNRLNREVGSDPKYGGSVFYNFAHCYSQMIPTENYYKDHPEYYALIDGKRDPSDLCLGNPELQRVFAENLIALAQANPQMNSVSVEPNDGSGGYCQCPLCKAMADPAHPDVLSNQVCAFNNIIARKVAAVVPEVKLHWLAYSGHTDPPTMVKQLEPNTIIQIAPINQWADYTKTFFDTSSGGNAGLRQSLQGWSDLKPSCLMMYEYWSGYGWAGPLPLTRVIADRLNNYRKFKVMGIYNESHPSWGPQGMDLYMCARSMWNPDLNLDKELNLYYKNFYGPAEKPMKAYHERLMNALANHYPPIFSGGRGMHLVLTPALVDELGGHMREAQSLVKGKPLYEKRLEGVAAGYEFSRRVCELLKLRKAEGVVTQVAGNRGTYLSTPKAEQAFEDLRKWLLTFDKGDAVFDIATKPPYYASSIVYMQDDLLKNGAFSYLSEEDLLKDFAGK